MGNRRRSQRRSWQGHHPRLLLPQSRSLHKLLVVPARRDDLTSAFQRMREKAVPRVAAEPSSEDSWRERRRMCPSRSRSRLLTLVMLVYLSLKLDGRVSRSHNDRVESGEGGCLQGRDVSTRRRLTVRRATGGSDSESSDSTCRDLISDAPRDGFRMATYDFTLFSRSSLPVLVSQEDGGENFSLLTLRLNP